MSDLISRQDAIDAYGDWYVEEGTVEGFIGTVKQLLEGLPSAQPKTPLYVAEIESEYKKWVNVPQIDKPLAKALYEVWKKHDREDVNRNE